MRNNSLIYHQPYGENFVLCGRTSWCDNLWSIRAILSTGRYNMDNLLHFALHHVQNGAITSELQSIWYSALRDNTKSEPSDCTLFYCRNVSDFWFLVWFHRLVSSTETSNVYSDWQWLMTALPLNQRHCTVIGYAGFLHATAMTASAVINPVVGCVLTTLFPARADCVCLPNYV